MDAPKAKRAAPDRATRYTTTDTLNHTATNKVLQSAHIIACTNYDGGAAVPFQSFGTRTKFKAIARPLRPGCPAEAHRV